MSISEQKWSKAPWQSLPASRACQWAQLCSLALKHHLKVQADNHLNDLFFLYTQHLVRGCLSQESSTLNLRMLQQNCFTSSQPDFQGRFHLQIITSCKPFTLSMSCCEECAVLLKLSSPAPTANLSTPQIGLGSELQSEFLLSFRKQSKPRCLITQSATGVTAEGTGFQPLSDPDTQAALFMPKIWHWMAFVNFFFFLTRTTSILGKAAGILLLHLFWMKYVFW